MLFCLFFFSLSQVSPGRALPALLNLKGLTKRKQVNHSWFYLFSFMIEREKKNGGPSRRRVLLLLLGFKKKEAPERWR